MHLEEEVCEALRSLASEPLNNISCQQATLYPGGRVFGGGKWKTESVWGPGLLVGSLSICTGVVSLHGWLATSLGPIFLASF